MPLFKKVEPTIIKEYVPDLVNQEPVKKTLKEFSQLSKDESSKMFEIDPMISQQIGLASAKEKEQQRRFDVEVLKYVQKIQDQAFQEAYEKGIQEGTEKARLEVSEQLSGEYKKLFNNLNSTYSEIVKLRDDLYRQNEKEIINFCYLIAEKIITHQIERDPQWILSLIKKITHQEAYSEPAIIYLSAKDFSIIQQIGKDQLPNELLQVEFKVKETLSSGDINVSTPLGEINANLEERLKKIKSIINGDQNEF